MSKTIEIYRQKFEKWHNEFYGPQNEFNPIRSLDFDSCNVGLGYDDLTVQAQFCAFQGALAAPIVERQEPADNWADGTGNLYRLCPAVGNLQIKVSAYGEAEKWEKVQMTPAHALTKLHPLYTSPPAPVAAMHSCGLDVHTQCSACLDKVKEMNQ